MTRCFAGGCVTHCGEHRRPERVWAVSGKGEFMASRFVLRIQFGPYQDAKRITRQLLKLVKETPVDEIMFFLFAEEMNNGHETIEEIKEWLDASRPYREQLAEEGVVISLNPWSTLLHCDRSRKLKPSQQWQTMVDQNGKAADVVACPLDPGWREYANQAFALYAREEVDVIWIEDDIRLHNHAPLDWGGCFCPLHVERFSEKIGESVTREEIVKRCTAQGKPHPWREIWLDVWQESLLPTIDTWRKIVQDGGSRLGLMSSVIGSHSVEGRRWNQWWQALAGNKVPVHRPNVWPYGDTTGAYLPRSIARLEQNRAVQPAEIRSDPEIECSPYSVWNKSFRQIFAQMALAHVLGSTGLCISLYDFMGNDPQDESERAEFLKRSRSACDWLADQFPMTWKSDGVHIVWSADHGRSVHIDSPDGKWQSLCDPLTGWAGWLNGAGIPFSMRSRGKINALSGQSAWTMEQSELQELLSGSLLLDGKAADIIARRGLSELIGIRQGCMISQPDALYSMESCTDERFSLRKDARISINCAEYATLIFQGELVEGAQAVSDLRDPRNRVVGHGAVTFENKLGGRIVTVPWAADDIEATKMNIQRAVQIRQMVQWLDTDRSVGMATGGAWLVPQFLTNGDIWRAVVWNAGSDDVNTVDLTLPRDMGQPGFAFQFNAAGEKHEIAIKDGVVDLDTPLRSWEFIVFGDKLV